MSCHCLLISNRSNPIRASDRENAGKILPGNLKTYRFSGLKGSGLKSPIKILTTGMASADQDEITLRLDEVSRQLSTSSNTGRTQSKRSGRSGSPRDSDHEGGDEADDNGESPVRQRDRMNLESSFFSEKDSANVFTNMQRALQHQKPIFSLDYGIITVEAAQR